MCCPSLRCLRKGLMVADAPRRQGSFACPRCKNTLREVTRVLPLQNADGLIAYECPACSYVTSVIWPAGKQTTLKLRPTGLGSGIDKHRPD